MERTERTETIGVRCTPKEKRMFERVAQEQGMPSVSDYMRAAAMMAAMIDGDGEAVKITAALVKAKFAGFPLVARRAVGIPEPA